MAGPEHQDPYEQHEADLRRAFEERDARIRELEAIIFRLACDCGCGGEYTPDRESVPKFERVTHARSCSAVQALGEKGLVHADTG